jgi:hypothetical protein
MIRRAIFMDIGFRHLDLPRGQDGLVNLLNVYCWRANARGT